MVGLVLAFVWIAIVIIFSGTRLESAYDDATGFLFHWYAFWNVVVGILVMILSFVLMSTGAASGNRFARSRLDKIVGMLGGAALGTAISGWIFFCFLLKAILYVGGAWLLMTADDGARSFAQFNTPKMVIGGIMIIVGIIWDRSKSNEGSSGSSSN